MIFKKYTFPEFQDPVGTLPVLHSKEFQEVFNKNNNKLSLIITQEPNGPDLCINHNIMDSIESSNYQIHTLAFIRCSCSIFREMFGWPVIDLTHWGRVTHICVGNLTIIGPDNGLSPGRRQAIIWTNAGILLIGPWGTNFSEILIGIQAFSFKKMHLKMSSAKWRPFCLGLNVLISLFA